MELLVLGPLEVRRDGEPLPVRRGRPRRLLLSLLLRRGDPVPRDVLIDQLWGDEPPLNADNALHLLVSHLRRAIAGAEPRIDRLPGGYRLVIARDRVDLFRFEELVRAATAGDVDPARRVRLAEEALALWRGPALSEARDDAFAQGEIARLDELRLQAQEDRADGLLALGRHDEALPDLGQLVREHPFRERLQGRLALALYRAGRQADALRALERARTALVDELGLDPSPQLQELERQILRQDPALDAVRAPHLPAVPTTVTGPVADGPPAGPAPAEPAPAASPPPAVPAVPLALTPLVGRAEEVAAVRRALGDHRLVTLTGPGGAGKTRLAAEAVRAHGTPVWWADLAAVASPSAVGTAVAAATGARPSGDDAVGELRRRIGDRAAVLVLDTCEHVLDEVERVVRGLLAGCPALRVLATSRRALGVVGEVVRPVPGLALPDPGEASTAGIGATPAVQLFCDRAAAVRPGFALDGSNARAVATVCRLLDGLPLAIELAAGHVAALSPATIADLLHDRMRLLGDGDARRGRHGGLRATLEWSYELLSAEESTFLDRLSVLAGRFPLDAGVEIAGSGLATDGLQLLLSLVRQSLVAVTDDDHFRLLDTVRAHAAERLARDPAEESAARDRHARWFGAFARDADRHIRGADQAGWLADLRAARADLRAALHHCLDGTAPRAALGARTVCSLSWFWSYEGSFTEAREWIARATAAGPHEPQIDAWLHLAAGMHAESTGDLRLAEAECTAAVDGFAAIDDVRGEARSLLHLGTARWALGDLPAAAAVQDRSIALFRSARHDSGAGLGLVLRARTALDQGDAPRAHELLLEARHVLRRAGDPHLVALCLEQQARTRLAEGDPAAAEPPARESLAVFESVAYREGVAAALQTLGQVHLELGDPGTAAALHRRAAGEALDLGHAGALAESLELLAGALLAAGDATSAALLLGHAEHVREEHGVPRLPSSGRRLDRWRARLPGDADAALAEGRLWATRDLLARAAPAVAPPPQGPPRTAPRAGASMTRR